MADKTLDQVLITLLPDEYCVQIGKVVWQWAWTEGLIDSAIWRLLGVSWRKGRAVTSHLPSRSKIDMLLTLMNLTRRDKSKLAHLAKEGKFLAQQRNLVAHGFASTDPTNPIIATFISFDARGELTSRTRYARPDMIEALAKKIAKYNAFLLEFSEDLPGIPPSRSKPPKLKTLSPNAQRRLLQTKAKQLPPPLGWSPEEIQKEQQAQNRAARLARNAQGRHKKPKKRPSRQHPSS